MNPNVYGIIAGILTSVSIIAIIIWVISEVIFMVARRGNLYSINANNLCIGIGFFVYWIAALLLAYFNLGFYNLNIVLFKSIGLLSFLAGIYLRSRSFLVLGEYFTPNITLQAEQSLIENGPYRYIRHPSYLGGVIIYLGISLLIMNWLLFVFSFIWFIMIYLLRIQKEERQLLNKFGHSYEKYQKKTKKIIPFIY